MTSPTPIAKTVEIFDPTHYAQARKPAEEAMTLPPWCYTSTEFHARELDVFRRSWLCVGRSDEVAQPGDYVTRQLAGSPLILLRDRNGTLHAFANTCRHRGTLLLEGAGNCRAVRCPYHGWVYGLDGSLIGTPGMDEVRDFDRSRYGLLPIRLESWDGFLFANFDPAVPSLAEHLGDCPEMHAPWSLAQMVVTRRRNFDVHCNWKLFIDVFMEYYHLQSVHAQSIGSIYGPASQPDRTRGEYASEFAAHVSEGTGALIKGRHNRTFPTISTLSGRECTGSRYTLVFPSFIFACTTDAMWFFEIDPLASDLTRVAMVSCFPSATVAMTNFEEIAKAYYERWDIAIAEDNAILECQQRGLTSPHALPGRLSHLEVMVRILGTWVVDRVLADCS